MKKKIVIFLISFFLICSSAFAFNEEKAKTDYKGADFKIASVKEALYENAPSIIISFTAPLSRKRLKDRYVSLQGGESDHWIINKDQTKLIFPFVNPETYYKVHITNDVRDVNGQKLYKGLTKSIKTKKLHPGVNFSSSGHIICSTGPKLLPVSTLNVNEVNIDFFLINNVNIPKLLQRLSGNGSYGYYNVNYLKQYGKLVHSGRFALNPRKNQRTEYNINLEGIDKLKKPGLYAAVMTKAGEYEYDYEYAYFVNTDIGVHVRKYSSVMDVYTQEISTGKPIKNVKTSILNKKGDILYSMESDELGRSSFHISSGQYYLTASKNDQVSVIALNRNALDLSGLKNAVTSHSEYQIYSWGPRNLYRPSEKIKVNTLVRDFDGKLPPAMPISYMLYKPDGSTAGSGRIQPDEGQLYKFTYQTNKNSQTGQYHLKFTYASQNTSIYYFKLEEFLPERIDLTLFDGDYDKKRILKNTSLIEVPVVSHYLYGAPASGNKVDGFIAASVDEHPFEKLPTFTFGDKEESIGFERKNFNEINLSKTGTGTLSMENKWLSVKSPVKLRVNASVYESGGRPVTRHSSATLMNGNQFIGIEPEFKGNPDSNSTADIKIGCVDKDGNWLKNKTLQVSLIRKDRNWYWRHSSSRGWHWDFDENPVVVYSKSINIKNNTEVVSLPLSWGSYKVEVTDGKTKSAYNFKTSWSWWGNASNTNSQKPDMISLGFEHTTYKPGEKARLRIDPPQDGLGLLTIECSEGVLFTKYLPVKSGGTFYDIKTDPSWNRHDIYASLMVIRPGDKKETPVPSRAFGMIHIPLKRSATLFKVDVEAPEKTEPGKTIKAKIKVEANNKIPPNTKVVVSLVDVGILNITRYKTPDAESYFFGARRYNVDLFDNYGQVIDNIGPKTARQRFGGGFSESDEELARGGNKPKSDVMMVSFFSEPMELNDKGEVTAEFKLPDFNGKLRWMVMVYSDDQFGSAEAETKVADKVVTQLSMPRFLALGDHSTIAIDLQNMSGTDQKLKLLTSIDGSLASREDTKSFDIKDKEKRTFKFSIQAIESNGQGNISCLVTSDDKTINIKRVWHLGVRSPYPAVTRSSFAVISPGKSWKPELKTKDLLKETMKFQMILSNNPPIDFSGHFNYLLHYPYGCLEQSTSSSYPWLLSKPEALKGLGLIEKIEKQFDRTYDEAFRKEQIRKGAARIIDRQKTNGSFGLWSSNSPEEKWLTVYAAEFLNDALKEGTNISPQAIKKANSRLRKYLRGNYSTNSNRWSEDNDHYEFAFRSYAGYVLAKLGKVNLRDLRRLSDKYKGKTKDDGLSWQYMAVAFKLTGDRKNSELCYDQAMKELKRERYRYYGEYGSNIRDLARITELATDYGFKNNNSLIFDLSNAVKERNWLSTQERISLFRVALILNKNSSEKWEADIITNNKSQKISRAKSFNSIFDFEKWETLQSVKAFNDTIYAKVNMVGEPIKAPDEQSHELTIKRKFYDTNGNVIIPDQMKTGELAIVQLIVSSNKRTPDGLVVDLLPAGVEIENQNLGVSSISINDIKIDGKPVGELKSTNALKHEEFRDDRYVAAVDINSYGSISLFYLIKAVTPGTYKMPASYVEDMYRPYRFGIGKTLNEIEVFE